MNDRPTYIASCSFGKTVEEIDRRLDFEERQLTLF